MILPQFDVLVPETLDEACAMLVKHRDDGVSILAGGTDLLVDLRRPIISQHVPRCDGCPTHPQGMIRSTIECSLWSSEPVMDAGGSLRAALMGSKSRAFRYLVSLHKLAELRSISILDSDELKIGATATITEIERSEVIRENWTALAEGADSLGSPLVRNRGTLGGNIANARPAADTAIPTIALGGQLVLTGMSSNRTVPAKDFPKGPGVTVIKTDEILTAVIYPAPVPYSGSVYRKLANRKALEISTVGVAVWIALSEPGGRVKDVRVALGAVGPTPILAESVRNVLVGKIPNEKILNEAARAAGEDARPIDDHRGSAAYRLEMVAILTERLLKIALERAGGSK